MSDDQITVLPSVTHGVWRLCTHGNAEVVEMIGSEFVLTSHPLSMSGDEVRARVKRVNPWMRVHLVRLDGSTVHDG